MANRGTGTGKAADIVVDTPTVKSKQTVPAVEDQTYVGFIAGALLVAILAGFLLATIVPLAQAEVIPGASRVPRLIQAHGWAQLQGWAGLFVAGMAIRLIPRFAGRQPIRGKVTVPILAALLASVALRIVVEPWVDGDPGDVLLVVGGVLGGLGMLAVAAVLAVTLAKGRRKGDPWELFAWLGTGWWVAWAVYTVFAAVRATDFAIPRMTPLLLDDAMTWMVMLGAVGNFIRGVQSRSVPVFFGRKLPKLSRVLPQAIALNAGLVLVMVSLAEWDRDVSARIEGGGLVLAGLATASLAPLTGSVWGTAHRLRPRAQSAARFVLAANIAGVVAGLLLAYAGMSTLVDGAITAVPARDAARHAFGVGLITMLVFGMAQLVAPMFALSRAEAKPPSLVQRAPFWLLVAATILRVGAALLRDEADSDAVHHTIALSGALAWLALVLFAATVFKALRDEPRMKAILADNAREAIARNAQKKAS
jgi:hypothetical protein